MIVSMFIRWATWWPVPYWTNRFEYLANCDEVDFEAIFLSGQSSQLDHKADVSSFGFRHAFLSRRQDAAGYGTKFRVRFPRPWPLVRGDFDALILPYSEASCIAAAFLAWGLRKPHFLFAPNTVNDERKESRFRDMLKRRLFSNATGILVTGPAQRDYALQYTDDPSKISIIGNPVGSIGSERYTAETRERLRIGFSWDNRNILLYVGRLAPEKGLLTLIEALSKVPLVERPKLILVGSGPLELNLREKASELSVEAEFAGFLQGEDLAQRYAAADLFVLPSESEPWGLVVNEAMASGLAVILSSHVGCGPVLLEEGGNGLIFPVGDAGALASCLMRLSGDEDMRWRMGQRSKEIVREQSIENWADALISAVRKSR